ncbi:MAG: GAF domain-containing protein [Bacillota bacterium]
MNGKITPKEVIFSIIETLVVNIAVYLYFYQMQPNQELYLNLNPHPLLFLCMFIGMRYGNKLGIISAFVSSSFFLKVFLELHNNDMRLLIYYFSNYKYILLFFWSAVIFGRFRDNYRNNIFKLTEENTLLKDNYKQLNINYKASLKVQEELKKQIINSEESILNLYETAASLDTLEIEEVFTEAIKIFQKYLRASSVSIYTYDEKSDYLRLKLRMGDEIISKPSTKVSNSLGYEMVVKGKKSVRWSEVKEGYFPLMAGPLIIKNKVIAIINIEHMDFDKLSEYAFQLFRLIISWVNNSINQAMYVEGLRGDKYIPGTNVIKYPYFAERLQEEGRRKKDFNLDFVYLQYKLNNYSTFDVIEKISRLFRTVDVLSFDENNGILHILLPATSLDNLPIISARVLSKINNMARP